MTGSALPFGVATSFLAEHSAPTVSLLPQGAARSKTQRDAIQPTALPSAISPKVHTMLNWHRHPAGRQARSLGRQLLVARCQQLPNSTAVSSASDESRGSIAADVSSSDDDAGSMLEAYGNAASLAAAREPDSLPETVREPVAGVEMEGRDFRVVSSSLDSRIDYLGESTKGDMKLPLTLPDDLGEERRGEGGRVLR